MMDLSVESDGDFPDLASMIRKHSGRAEASMKQRINHPETKRQNLHDLVDQSSNRNTTSSILRLEPIDKDWNQPIPTPQKLKARRRILNNKCDNPLLHPLQEEIPKRSTVNITRYPAETKTRPSKKDLLLCSNITRVSPGNTSLSNFIVSDELSGEDHLEHSHVPTPRDSKPKRRLFKGRRVDGRTPGEDAIGMSSGLVASVENNEPSGMQLTTVTKPVEGSSAENYDSDGWFEDRNVILSFTPFNKVSPRKLEMDHTPAASPNKNQKGLVSPKKPAPIPSTPHRSSTDEFWSQDLVNAWNDEYSPRKTPWSTMMTVEKLNITPMETSKSKIVDKDTSKVYRFASKERKTFEKKKHVIAESFLSEIDNTITDGQLSKMTKSTGGIKILWSNKLNTTAGRANWKRETIKSGCLATTEHPCVRYRHFASIELSEKVIDDEHKLLNVVAHEFCHLANFMVSGVKNNPHGKEFKEWALRCSAAFGQRGIEVTTKHSFTIEYKYIWNCTSCGLQFKRHSKSIDPEKHQCGSCKSKLVQTKPIPRVKRAPSEYQVFVKDNMRRIREENPGSPQKEIMAMLGKSYKVFKEKGREGPEMGRMTLKSEEVSETGQTPPTDNIMDSVVKKLDFLDLTRE